MSQQSYNDDLLADPTLAGPDDGMFAQEEVGQPVAMPQQYAPPRFNIYSMLLLLSFLFCLSAAIILYVNVK